MNCNCIICENNIDLKKTGFSFCKKCSAKYDKFMNFIPSRHNWNLDDFSKSFDKENKLFDLEHQN